MLDQKSIFPPSEEFSKQANIKSFDEYKKLCLEAEENLEQFWAKYAKEILLWHKPFTKILDESKKPFYKWFYDGELNASYNSLDRHLETKADKIALIFEADDGAITNVTYKELYEKVCQFANGLKALNIKMGDRVLIYMPMSVEAIVAMQACARIGAIHSVVFGGFSAKSVCDRMVDADAVTIITADEQMRGGKKIPLKKTVDEALSFCDAPSVKNVIFYQRTGADINLKPGFDVLWQDLIKDQPLTCEPTWVNAEHPLFILYTSGSTGKPKGVQHSTAGFMLHAMLTMQWTFDIKDQDIFWCTADVGWITGHTYIAYGPLAVGATQIIFEGVPTYPDASRFWQMIEKHKSTIFYTAPTAIRALIKLGADLPKNHDLSSLRLLGTVGEPINPEAWRWYYDVVGQKRCPIVDTWWQTETGGHVLTPLPGATPLKPGSCTFPLPGIITAIVDSDMKELGRGEEGVLVIKNPWPSMIRTVWNNPERYIKTYYPPEYKGYYLAGDGASIDEDGYYWITGRIDDVVNVSGHRLGTMEVESVLAAHKDVAEAAVVGVPDDIKGEALVAFVVLKEGSKKDNMFDTLRAFVAKEISPIAKPKEIYFGENLPKTRSGKTMRRLLRTIAKGEEITQDISTLENPHILKHWQEIVNQA